MVLSGSTSCYNYWQNIGNNYGNTHNSEFYVPCILKSQVKPNTNTGDLKVKACLFEQSSKKKPKTIIDIGFNSQAQKECCKSLLHQGFRYLKPTL